MPDDDKVAGANRPDHIINLDPEDVDRPVTADLDMPVVKAGDLTSTPYDRDRKQDSDRALISFILLAMLFVIILLGFVMCLWALGPADDIETNLKTVVAFLNIVFGPIVTLVGSATGFYFGTRTGGGRQV